MLEVNKSRCNQMGKVSGLGNFLGNSELQDKTIARIVIKYRSRTQITNVKSTSFRCEDYLCLKPKRPNSFANLKDLNKH